jgi:Glycosyltransferase family 10 (fucosyltransferase) C-term
MTAKADREGRKEAIRIFRADPMDRTPFELRPQPNPVLQLAGVTFVNDPREADIIIARRTKFLASYGQHDKAFAIWTHEPRWSRGSARVQHHERVRNPIYVMNAYGGGIYFDEFYNFGGPRPKFDDAMRRFCVKPSRAVMLASYRASPTRVMLGGRDLDLLQYRQQLALYLQERGFCDIHGRDWPNTVQISGNTRADGWQAKKREVLRDYAVNLAFENTLILHYVSEKIWDAVANACLPVYHGGNGIHRIFPQGSFIDADGKNIEELADQILAMSRSEMAARYEACLRAYLDIYDEDLQKTSRHACWHRTAEFLTNAVAAHASGLDGARMPASRCASFYVFPAFDAARRAWRQMFSRRSKK